MLHATTKDRTIDFFERLDDIKIKRRHLVAALIVVELVGIIILVWYLRVPLTQKYLASSPVTYALKDFNQALRYKVFLGDFITHQTSPTNKVIALIASNKDRSKKTKIRISPAVDGSWYLRVPEGLGEGRYRMTVGVFDQNNGLVSLDNYKLTVGLSNILLNNRFSRSQDSKSTQNSASDIQNPEKFLESLPSEEEINEVFNSLQSLEINYQQDYYSPPQNIEKPSLD